jgi:hypothetical protein
LLFPQNKYSLVIFEGSNVISREENCLLGLAQFSMATVHQRFRGMLLPFATCFVGFSLSSGGEIMKLID